MSAAVIAPRRDAISQRPPMKFGSSRFPVAADAAPRAPRPARDSSQNAAKGDGDRKPDHPILFQSFFKSVGSRTYAAQVKKASNGNQYLVITEGRRDKESGEVRKLRVNVFSEDFEAFFNLLRDTTRYIKEHPLPESFQKERLAFWKKAGARRKTAPQAAKSVSAKQ